MPEGLNRVMLLGNLGADPELRYGQGESERIRTTQSVLGRELDVLRSEKSRLDEAIQGTGEGLARIEVEARSLKQGIEAQERTYAGLVAEAEGLERRYFEMKAGLDLVQEKINGLSDQVRATEKRREAATAKIQQLEADALRSEDGKTRLREEIGVLREERQGPGRRAHPRRGRPFGSGWLSYAVAPLVKDSHPFVHTRTLAKSAP